MPNTPKTSPNFFPYRATLLPNKVGCSGFLLCKHCQNNVRLNKKSQTMWHVPGSCLPFFAFSHFRTAEAIMLGSGKKRGTAHGHMTTEMQMLYGGKN